jgi:hypothetical protein
VRAQNAEQAEANAQQAERARNRAELAEQRLDALQCQLEERVREVAALRSAAAMLSPRKVASAHASATTVVATPPGAFVVGARALSIVSERVRAHSDATTCAHVSVLSTSVTGAVGCDAVRD